MRLDVVPERGIGPVRLGMTRPEVAAAMGEQPTRFLKTPASVHETDAFFGGGLQVFYSPDSSLVDYIEVSRGAGLIPVVFGVDVFGTPASEIVALVEAAAPLDRSNPELGYSYGFPQLGLSLWRPVMPEDDNDSEGRFFSTVGVGHPSASG